MSEFNPPDDRYITFKAQTMPIPEPGKEVVLEMPYTWSLFSVQVIPATYEMLVITREETGTERQSRHYRKEP